MFTETKKLCWIYAEGTTVTDKYCKQKNSYTSHNTKKLLSQPQIYLPKQLSNTRQTSDTGDSRHAKQALHKTVYNHISAIAFELLEMCKQ